MPGAYDPDQVERLIVSIDSLESAFAVHKQALARAEKRTKYAKSASIVGMLVGIVGVAVGVTAWGVADDVRELSADRQRETVEVRTSACVQFNVQRNEVRSTMKLALTSLAPPEAARTEAQRASLEVYSKAVDLGLPYRDCSPQGIEAYFKSPPKDPAGPGGTG